MIPLLADSAAGGSTLNTYYSERQLNPRSGTPFVPNGLQTVFLPLLYSSQSYLTLTLTLTVVRDSQMFDQLFPPLRAFDRRRFFHVRSACSDRDPVPLLTIYCRSQYRTFLLTMKWRLHKTK